ncbi:MAG: hypothetical protein LUQ13_02005 [Methanomicrobiales archaeon]|nr:hypothetical protein [Methanomicrobiales archaeon]
MNAAELLGLDAIRFIEPSFADLTNTFYTHVLLEIPSSQGILLIDENNIPIALAVSGGEAWIACSFLCRDPTREAIEKIEELEGEILQATREEWAAAVRAYYSLEIQNSVTPALEDVPPSRLRQVEDLLRELWDGPAGMRCLDCCCGSGIGSRALHAIGLVPLAYDNDASLLSRGFSTGRLRLNETVCIDATRASHYLPHSGRGLVLMLGSINPYDAAMWKEILAEILELCEEALITVGTREEAEKIQEWTAPTGRSFSLRENTRDPIYDRWVCRIGGPADAGLSNE